MENQSSQLSNEGTKVQLQSRNDSLSSIQQTEDVDAQRSRYQKVYNAFGFTKAYNFPLYIVCAGALFGFSLSRLEDFNFDGNFPINVRPGHWFYFFQPGAFRTGMIMHLAGAIPLGILAVLQFTPIIRHKFILFHRMNGYTCLLLILVSNIGCSILIRRPAGTDIPWQTVGAVLIFLTTFSAIMAYWNIKKLQIDQHRAWMLRCIFYMGTAVTSRLILFSGAAIISRIGGFHDIWPCDKIDFTYRQFGFDGILPLKYPQCLSPNGTLDGEVVVRAIFDVTAPEEAGASAGILSGPSLWLATIVHLVGVEIYLALTPRESLRLRQVSYEKQLAAGFKSPGSAGTTIEKWGDAEKWEPNLTNVESKA